MVVHLALEIGEDAAAVPPAVVEKTDCVVADCLCLDAVECGGCYEARELHLAVALDLFNEEVIGDV